MKKPKRNKQDATLININALKKRMKLLEKIVHEIHDSYAFVIREVLRIKREGK